MCEVHTFMARFAKFALMALQNKRGTIRHTVNCMLQTNCTFARNVKDLARLSNFELDSLNHINVKALLCRVTCICKEQCKSDRNIACLASVLRELTQIRGKLMACDLRRQEIEIIWDICVN